VWGLLASKPDVQGLARCVDGLNPISVGPAGVEARASPGSIAKGEGLTVIFQDWELSKDGVGVWLTVANRAKGLIGGSAQY
jgi:hypothetical protein